MKRTLTTLLGASAALALLAGCGSAEEADDTFNIDTGVSGMADAVYPSGKCKFYDHMLSPGDPVIVRGAGDTILAKTELTRTWQSPDHANGTQASADGSSDICMFNFKVDGIEAGESAYQVQIGDYQPVVVSQDEFVVDYFRPRGSVNAAMGQEPMAALPDNTTTSSSIRPSK